MHGAADDGNLVLYQAGNPYGMLKTAGGGGMHTLDLSDREPKLHRAGVA